MSADEASRWDEAESVRERTFLAEERTFTAWVRTGLTAIVTGLGVVRLLPPMRPNWLVQVLGVTLVATGAAALCLGLWSYHKARGELRAPRVQRMPFWVLTLFTGALLLASVAALVLVLTP